MLLPPSRADLTLCVERATQELEQINSSGGLCTDEPYIAVRRGPAFVFRDNTAEKDKKTSGLCQHAQMTFLFPIIFPVPFEKSENCVILMDPLRARVAQWIEQ